MIECCSWVLGMFSTFIFRCITWPIPTFMNLMYLTINCFEIVCLKKLCSPPHQGPPRIVYYTNDYYVYTSRSSAACLRQKSGSMLLMKCTKSIDDMGAPCITPSFHYFIIPQFLAVYILLILTHTNSLYIMFPVTFCCVR